ncbi:SUKH-4 family immunity protein [Streptomyces parvus]|uniref:SUKH-4 family immunity protein n=1 Tax=Streptomyces TaxID=1883 RepID=UPI001F16C85A|nr:SUKH-4 family immunity protein [Streptomyces sp. CS149]
MRVPRASDHYGMLRPAESRSWWMLGYLFTSLIALDPASGKVYAFPEGSSGYVPLHRDVESLVYALVEFRKPEVDHDNGVDPEELSATGVVLCTGLLATVAPRTSPQRTASDDLLRVQRHPPFEVAGTFRHCP